MATTYQITPETAKIWKSIVQSLQDLLTPEQKTDSQFAPGEYKKIGKVLASLVMPETIGQGLETGLLSMNPGYIAANYRTSDAIKALRKLIAEENRARGTMATQFEMPQHNFKNFEDFAEWNKKYAEPSTIKGLWEKLHTPREVGPDPIDQIVRGSWFHGMRPEARESLRQPGFQGSNREFGEHFLNQANQRGLPGSTHANPTYTRFGEPSGISISASPTIARNFSLDDYIHRVQPLFGGPPSQRIIPMWRPEGVQAMQEGYNTAFNQWLTKDMGLMGPYPLVTNYGSPDKLLARELTGEAMTNSPNLESAIFNMLDKAQAGSGAKPIGEFNTLYSKALQDQGYRGILYSPQRYGEYEMLMLDPKYVRPLDYRKVEEYLNPRMGEGGYTEYPGFPSPDTRPNLVATPGARKGYDTARPELETSPTRLSDVFSQQSWVDRINYENKKRIIDLIDAKYRELIAKQLFNE